jgi:hypothetical protein
MKTPIQGKEWFEKSKYVYDLEEHDESGYLGIDEDKVAEMLDDYYQYKLKLLGLHIVRQHREQLIAFAEFLYEGHHKELSRIVDDYLNSK